MKCGKCGGENPTDSKYCADCGGPLLPVSVTPVPGSPVGPVPIFTMRGAGSLLEVFTDKVCITPKGFLGFALKGLKGTKSIPYFSISAIQFKAAGFTSGYLQFTLPGGIESQRGVFDATRDENTFMFHDGNEMATRIKEYIEKRIQEVRAPSLMLGSVADEIGKLAAMRASGALSNDEYLALKRRLVDA